MVNYFDSTYFDTGYWQDGGPTPLIVTDTIGGTDSSGADYPYLKAFQVVASDSGTLEALAVNIQTAAGNIQLFLYSTYSAGVLSGLLAQTGIIAAVSGRNILPVSGSAPIVEGTTYYIGIVTDNGSLETYATHDPSALELYYTFSWPTLLDPTPALNSETGAFVVNLSMIYGSSTRSTIVDGDAIQIADALSEISRTGSDNISIDDEKILDKAILQSDGISVSDIDPITILTDTGDIRFNGTPFPHVLTIEVTEDVYIDTRGVNLGLPEREFSGHKGRVVKVTGWLDDIGDLAPIGGLEDGRVYTLTLPTGDVLPARITMLTPKPDVTATQWEVAYEAEIHEALTADAGPAGVSGGTGG